MKKNGKFIELILDIIGMCMLIVMLFFLGLCELIDETVMRKRREKKLKRGREHF